LRRFREHLPAPIREHEIARHQAVRFEQRDELVVILYAFLRVELVDLACSSEHFMRAAVVADIHIVCIASHEAAVSERGHHSFSWLTMSSPACALAAKPKSVAPCARPFTVCAAIPLTISFAAPSTVCVVTFATSGSIACSTGCAAFSMSGPATA